MAAGYCLDLEEAGGLVDVGGLAIPHLIFRGVQSVGAYKVRGSRHVALHQPLEALNSLVGGVVGLGNYLVRASLVLGQLVFGLPPGAVLLAYRIKNPQFKT
ncbi:hypothetical protein Tsubulata_016795 [Turnera subulata]|uniref:Uncharacterized protein n=1 Tax=Turnera subulata TaxID=218843 RepID=A0A9Q0J3M8_9ROSI|nr:hypothetical protein Tsubulata_016795 [Turnera subulata]